MLLGITADSIPSAHPSMAFGTTLKSCRHLLETAKEQAVEVVGIRYIWDLGSSALLGQRSDPAALLGGEVEAGIWPCWDQFGAGSTLRKAPWGSAGLAWDGVWEAARSE